MIEVISAGLLTTIQDQGRYGMRRYGVGPSGCIDPVSAAIANALAGNDDDAAVIELTMPPAKLKFHSATTIALTGATCVGSLDGKPIHNWWAIPVEVGQVLTIASSHDGARSYLGIAGGVDVPSTMGSRSTHLRSRFGGFSGRALEKKDHIPIGNALRRSTTPTGIWPPWESLGLVGRGSDPIHARILPGAEYDRFTEQSKESFFNSSWSVTPQSNRAGFRLHGDTPLTLTSPLELRSHGILPGVVQVPPDGQPIIQMADANVAGGYPKIASVISADLWKVAQARIGRSLRFELVTYAQAVEAKRAQNELVERIKEHIRMWI